MNSCVLFLSWGPSFSLSMWPARWSQTSQTLYLVADFHHGDRPPLVPRDPAGGYKRSEDPASELSVLSTTFYWF